MTQSTKSILCIVALSATIWLLLGAQAIARDADNTSKESIDLKERYDRIEMEGVLDATGGSEQYNWAPYRQKIKKSIASAVDKLNLRLPDPFLFAVTINRSGHVTSAVYLEKTKSMESINKALKTIKALSFPSLPTHFTGDSKEFKIPITPGESEQYY